MKSSTFTFTELSALCLELRLFLHAGADGSSAFSLLAEDCDDPELKNEYSHIASRIDEGLSLSAAMEESARFPKEMWSFLRIGESCGRSEEALSSLEKYYQQRHQWDRQLRSALLYPSVLLMVMLLVILLLLTEVLPIFQDVYLSFGSQMNGMAVYLLHFGEILRSILPLLLLLFAAAAITLLLFASKENLRQQVWTLLSNEKKTNSLNRKMKRAHFAQALSLALSSGLSAENTLDSLSLLLDDQQEALQNCRSLMDQGASFTDSMKNSDLLPAAECRLLSLGFTSGSSENAALEVARRLHEEAESAFEQRLSLIEPFMVTAASLFVAVILLAVLLPLTGVVSSLF